MSGRAEDFIVRLSEKIDPTITAGLSLMKCIKIQDNGLKKDEDVTDLCILVHVHTPATFKTISSITRLRKLHAAERGGGKGHGNFKK